MSLTGKLTLHAQGGLTFIELGREMVISAEAPVSRQEVRIIVATSPVGRFACMRTFRAR